MTQVNLEWESVNDNSCISTTERAKVFGGWLVKITDEVLQSMHEDQPPTEGYEWRTSICFLPDPNHEWGKPKTCPHENKVEAKTNNLITHISCIDCGEELYNFNRTTVDNHQADTTRISLQTKTTAC